MNQQNNDLLQFLGFNYYQEIEEYIKAVHLPYGSKQLLNQPINVIEICLLIYILIDKKSSFNLECKNDRIFIKHNFHENEDYILLKNIYPGLYELLSKSTQCGFMLVLNQPYNFLDFLQSKIQLHDQL